MLYGGFEQEGREKTGNRRTETKTTRGRIVKRGMKRKREEG